MSLSRMLQMACRKMMRLDFIGPRRRTGRRWPGCSVPAILEKLESRSLLSATLTLGPEFRLNTTTDGGPAEFFHGGLYPVSGDQFAVQLASNAAGQYAAVWQGPNRDGRGTFDVFLQRLDSRGVPIGSVDDG